jgi:GNAT superfamily N-acetyltransferase
VPIHPHARPGNVLADGYLGQPDLTARRRSGCHARAIAAHTGGQREAGHMPIEIREAGPSTWSDVAAVLGSNGGYSGCWCTFWRLTNQVIHNQSKDDNRVLLEQLVTSGEPVGLVLYLDGVPAGWCQIAPRPGFPRLFHTRGLDVDGPDDTEVWSIVCVYLVRTARGAGHADRLVSAAVEYSARHGAATLEAYPVTDAGTGKRSQLSSGTVGLFSRAGFGMRGEPTGRRVVMYRDVPSS